MLTAADVMTRNVITVSPETPVRDLARLLHQKHISGAPVVEAGTVVGVVSEGDLIGHAEVAGEARRSWWLRLFGSEEVQAGQYARSHGRFVRDVMTAPAITVEPDTPLPEIARLLEQRHIKRVPVVRQGALVGIISRANLLQAMAVAQTTKAVSNDDRSIRERLLKELENQPWANPGTKNILVQDGVVHLWGFVRSDEERRAVRVAAENAGASAVEDHLREYRGAIGSAWS